MHTCRSTEGRQELQRLRVPRLAAAEWELLEYIHRNHRHPPEPEGTRSEEGELPDELRRPHLSEQITQ